MVPAGHLRLDIDANYVTWDERFGLRSEGTSPVEGVEPLGSSLSNDALGSDELLVVALTEARLRTVLEDAEYQMNLGNTTHLLAAHVRRVPLGFRLGVFRWLTVGASLPMVQRKLDSELAYNATGANAGLPPPRSASNEFLGQYGTALSSARAEVERRCAAGTDTPECRAGQGALQEGDALFDLLSSLFIELPFFPLEESDAGQALSGLMEDVRSGLSELGVTGFTDPLPLGSPLNQTSFNSRVVAPLFGAEGLPLNGLESLWEPGDLEVSAAIQVLNTFPAATPASGAGRQADSLATPGTDSLATPEDDSRGGLAVRLGLAGTLRMATGTPQDTLRDFLDMDVPEGQMDIEARVFGGLQWAGRLGLAFDVRYGIASPVSVRRRLIEPHAGFTPFPPLEPVRWRPGNYLEYAISPHLLLTPQFSLGLLYRSHTRQADTFDGSAADLSPLSLETEATVQSVGLDFRYSSFRGGGFPLEVNFGWESARSGTGGRTPKTGRVRFGASLFSRIWGGD